MKLFNCVNITINSTKFIQNKANKSIGGGLLIILSENIIMNNLNFYNNSAIDASGLYIHSSKNIDINMLNC